MGEYQFTVRRRIVVEALGSVTSDNEKDARQLALVGEFSSIEETNRIEESTDTIVSLDGFERDCTD